MNQEERLILFIDYTVADKDKDIQMKCIFFPIVFS